jgi:hypothetical protein
VTPPIEIGNAGIAAILGNAATDLDPASSAEAQKIIGAKEFYTKRTNGLTKEA